jgi:hypothetical protein
VGVVVAMPRAVRRIEHCWIPLPDGCRLAARLWLPEDADRVPVPAVVEYIPYRKRDFTRTRDEPMHHYFAGHGYAALHVDVRGTGESDGVLEDEYSEQEIADGVALIAWIAAQPWCTGAVGMIGKSWGGINVLQIATHRPPALRTIVSVCGSDDRYADDAHYMGGCLLNENLTWGSVLMAFAALPPDPALVGDGWRDAWLARLDALALFPERWLRHQRRDAYWERGSAGQDLSRIACPVYAVGGWADAYTNTVPRLLAGLSVPRKGLIGPWGHVYPHDGTPGEPIGFLQEVVRWWDQWLKGVDTGVLDEPCYRVWMSDDAGGRWVAERAWPSPRIAHERRALDSWRFDASQLTVCSPQSVGLTAGDWCAFGDEGDLPGDQRCDDERSITFDSPPLSGRIEILGSPAVVLGLSVDRPAGFVAVRLNEVLPDGASIRVTYGLLDLTQAAGERRALAPGRRRRVRIALNHVAHSFAPGSRIRVAISTAYWPVVWPSAEAVALTVFPRRSMLDLPVRPPSPGDARLRAFGRPERAAPAPYAALQPWQVHRSVERTGAGEVAHTITGAAAGRLEEIDLGIEQSSERRYRIRDDEPLAARAEVVQRLALRRGSWNVRVESQLRMSATRTTFRLQARVEAFEADACVRSRTWDVSVPRDAP